jgi:hypothetical protein
MVIRGRDQSIIGNYKPITDTMSFHGCLSDSVDAVIAHWEKMIADPKTLANFKTDDLK